MDDTSQVTPMRRFRIGDPLTGVWTYDEGPDALDLETAVMVSSRARYRQERSQHTIEAWEITDPERPRLICAWPSVEYTAQAVYRRMCVIPMAVVRGNGFRPATVAPNAPEPMSIETVADRERLARSNHASQFRSIPKRGPYRSESLTAIDQMAAIVIREAELELAS